MTISVTTAHVHYVGDGKTTVWPVPFPFGHADELLVKTRIIATGKEFVESTAAGDYSVQGGGRGEGPATTGTVTYASALLLTLEIWIFRVAPLRQGLDYNTFHIPERTHEEGFDQATLRLQEQKDEVNRLLKNPVSDEYNELQPPRRAPTAEFPDSVTRVNKTLQFDADGDPTAVVAPTPIAPSTLMDDFVTATTVAAARSVIETHDRSVVVNGGFQIDQRQGSYTSMVNDTYHLDHWYWLQEGGTAYNLTQETDGGPNGSPGYLQIAVNASAADRSFALVQIIEANKIEILRNGFSVGAYFRLGSAADILMTKVNLEVWEWTGTANAVTSALVGTWPAGLDRAVEGTNWNNLTSELLVATVTDSWSALQAKANTVAVSANATNLAIVIGTLYAGAGTSSLAEQLHVGGVSLVPTGGSNEFRERRFDEDLRQSMRFYQKTFPYGTAPAQSAGLNGALRTMAHGGTAPQHHFVFHHPHPVSMVATDPSKVTYNPSAANGSARNLTDGTDQALIAVDGTEESSTFRATVPADTDQNDEMAVHYVADASL